MPIRIFAPMLAAVLVAIMMLFLNAEGALLKNHFGALYLLMFTLLVLGTMLTFFRAKTWFQHSRDASVTLKRKSLLSNVSRRYKRLFVVLLVCYLSSFFASTGLSEPFRIGIAVFGALALILVFFLYRTSYRSEPPGAE